MFNSIIKWIKEGFSTPIIVGSNIILKFPDITIRRLDKVIITSAHANADDKPVSFVSFLKEALKISEVIYQQAELGKAVTCRVENGLISMYVDNDGPDGDDGLPLTSDNIIEVDFGRKAA